MATNFEVSIHRNSNAFHLKLEGDFDRSSAYDLLHVLQTSCGKASKVFIHTSRLKQINPFGRSVLHNNLQALNSLSVMPLVFTGKNATQLAPYEVRLISSL
jgi:ABC-type transporter Mla MlaB component